MNGPTGWLALFLVACGDESGSTHSGWTAHSCSGYTDSPVCRTFWSGPAVITSAAVECYPTGNTVTFDVQAQGWTDGGWLYEIETGSPSPWSEETDLVSYAWDSCGRWDELGASLATGSAVAEVERDVSTPFTCEDQYDAGVLTFAAAILDFDGTFADCLVWGADPEAVRDQAITGPNDPSFDPSLCAVGTTAG